MVPLARGEARRTAKLDRRQRYGVGIMKLRSAARLPSALRRR